MTFLRHFLKTLLLAFTAGFLSFNELSQAAVTKVIIKADKAYPPYSYEENGEMTGIYTDILKEAFARMPKYDISIEAVPWKRGLKELEDGKLFALYPPYFHVNKRPYIYPYSLPILDESLALICNDEAQKKIKQRVTMVWPTDFEGLHIGINRGFTVPKLDEARKAKSLKVSEVTSNSINLNKLAQGRVDCIINDYYSIASSLKREIVKGKIREDFKINLTHVISKEQGFLGYAANAKKFPFKDDFLRELNVHLYEMNRNGRIKEISDTYTNK